MVGFHFHLSIQILIGPVFHLFVRLLFLIGNSHSFFGQYSKLEELFEDEGFEPVNHSNEEEYILEKRKQELEEFIRQSGCRTGFKEPSIPMNLPRLKKDFCMADSPDGIMFNPLGQIGKCDHHLFTRLVGDIYQEGHEIDNCAFERWLNYEVEPDCEECALYPFCGKPLFCDEGNHCRKEHSEYECSYYSDVMVQIYHKVSALNKEGKNNGKT